MSFKDYGKKDLKASKVGREFIAYKGENQPGRNSG